MQSLQGLSLFIGWSVSVSAELVCNGLKVEGLERKAHVGFR